MKHIVSLSVFILLLSLIQSCSTIPRGATASSTPLKKENIAENLGRVEGRDAAWSVLFISIGRPDIDRAIENALQEKGGDALINVRLYEHNRFFILGARTEAIVVGEAVKLRQMAAE